jgi:hypothetical protein
MHELEHPRFLMQREVQIWMHVRRQTDVHILINNYIYWLFTENLLSSKRDEALKKGWVTHIFFSFIHTLKVTGTTTFDDIHSWNKKSRRVKVWRWGRQIWRGIAHRKISRFICLPIYISLNGYGEEVSSVFESKKVFRSIESRLMNANKKNCQRFAFVIFEVDGFI